MPESVYLMQDESGYFLRSAPPPRQGPRWCEWPQPVGALCQLYPLEALSLGYFDLMKPFCEVYAAEGLHAAERFADEAHLRLGMIDPDLHNLDDGHCFHNSDGMSGRDSFAEDIRRAIRRWPEFRRRQSPVECQVQLIRRGGGAVVLNDLFERPLAGDLIVAQLPSILWDLYREAPRAEEEVLAHVAAARPHNVAALVEDSARRGYADGRIVRHLGARTYSGFDDARAVLIVAGEDDPEPAGWRERRRELAVHDARLAAWARAYREEQWINGHDVDEQACEVVTTAYYGNEYKLAPDVADAVRRDIARQRRETRLRPARS